MITLYLYGQEEYANASLSGSTSFNDFADITLYAAGSAGYYWFMTTYYKLKAEDQTSNLSPYSDDVSINVEHEGLGLGKGVVKTDSPIPGKFNLHSNFPNPFNPTTTIVFDLQQDSHVQLRIYTIQGKQVAELLNQPLSAGFILKKISSG